MCTFYDICNNVTPFFCTKAFQEVDQDVRDLVKESWKFKMCRLYQTSVWLILHVN